MAMEAKRYVADDLIVIARSAMVALETVLESTDKLYDALASEFPEGAYEDMIAVLRSADDLDYSLHRMLMHAAWQRAEDRRRSEEG